MRSAWGVLCVLAAIGCRDSSRTAEGAAGTSGGGGAGGQHVAQFGDECTPTEDAGTSTSDCHGGVVDNQNECHPRFELVRCYIAELDDGAPKCLRASDPQVLGLIQDDVSQYGFVSQTVLREDEQRVLADRCEVSIACCASLPDKHHTGQRACFDDVEQYADCETSLSTFGCEPDAGADGPSQHGLCCYLACGYEHTS